LLILIEVSEYWMVDIYNTVIKLLGNKPNFNWCSKQDIWNHELTLLYHKEDLDWDHLNRMMVKTSTAHDSLKFLSKHPELHIYYNWIYITHHLSYKSNYYECPTPGFMPGLYPNLPWNSNILTKNTIEKHHNNDNAYHHCKNCFNYISSYPALPWDWNFASQYEYPDIDFIESHHQYNWDWKILSHKMRWEFMINHPNYRWDIDILFLRVSDMTEIDYNYVQNVYNIKILSLGCSLPMSIRETLTKLI